MCMLGLRNNEERKGKEERKPSGEGKINKVGEIGLQWCIKYETCEMGAMAEPGSTALQKHPARHCLLHFFTISFSFTAQRCFWHPTCVLPFQLHIRPVALACWLQGNLFFLVLSKFGPCLQRCYFIGYVSLKGVQIGHRRKTFFLSSAKLSRPMIGRFVPLSHVPFNGVAKPATRKHLSSGSLFP